MLKKRATDGICVSFCYVHVRLYCICLGDFNMHIGLLYVGTQEKRPVKPESDR